MHGEEEGGTYLDRYYRILRSVMGTPGGRGGTKLIAFEVGWQQIREQAIDVLLDQLKKGFNQGAKPFNNKEYMEVYTTCYKMCTQRAPKNFSDQLYSEHGNVISSYLANTVLPALSEKRDTLLLADLVTRWKHHQIMNKWMKRFFTYLDRYYVKHHSHKTLITVGILAFKSEVYAKIKDNIVSAILAQIARERDGEEVDHSQLKKCVGIFETMGESKLDCYINDFEDRLLTSSADHYKAKAALWIDSDDTPTYLRKAEAALEAEAKRVDDYLIGQTRPKLLSVCEKVLLDEHQKLLLERSTSGCAALMKQDRYEDLGRMYSLFSRLKEGLPPMAAIVGTYFLNCGMAVLKEREASLASKAAAGGKEKEVKESPSDPTLVKQLIALHKRCKSFVVDQFDKNTLFEKALKNAFEAFMNEDVGQFTNAEYLAHYSNRLLRKGNEKLTDAQVEELLDQIVQLFTYLNDKDLFSDIYRNLLSKRLLNGKSANDDAEKGMIARLKLKYGAQFTTKMEGMLNDLSTGTKHLDEFTRWMSKAEGDHSLGDVDFGVQVLTTGFWPRNPEVSIDLPMSMKRCSSAFKTYYIAETEHRKLKWVYSLGTCTIQMKVASKSYSLAVTTLQAACLCLFDEEAQKRDGNEPATLGFEEIRSKLNVEASIMKKILHSLSCAKAKVLRKEPKSKRVNASDTFTPNAKFSNKYRKLRLPMASLGPSYNPKRVQEDRSLSIEAAIVRIMKTRKKVSHSDLVAQVLKQLQFFQPRPKVCLALFVSPSFFPSLRLSPSP